MMLAAAAAVGCLAVAVGYAMSLSTVALISWGIASAVGTLVLVAALARSVKFLGQGEQLRVHRLTDTVVHNGPGVFFLNPLGYKKAEVVAATTLGPNDYVKIKDNTTGEARIERGPKVLFLGPYDTVELHSAGITLSKTEYLIYEDLQTGDAHMQKGPCVWFPGPYHRLEGGRSKSAIALQEDEYVRLQDRATGQRWVQRGKALVFLEPTWKTEGSVRKAWTLKAYEYVRLLDSVSGKITVHKGESTVFPGMNEDLLDGNVMAALDLGANEYVKIVDQTTSGVRVVTGPSLVFLGANEKFLQKGKQKAIEIDDEHAVRVRDISTGQLRLITEKQLFFPGPNEEVEGVQNLLTLADHEAMIVKDKDGNFHFHYGDAERADGASKGRSFFLPPHAEIVKLWWSGGLRRAKRDLCIERFDLRPQFMWNEIECRTQDNVELVLETTIFYEVKDLSRMVRTTGNLPGDIYNQIRSQFIKHVARLTLKGFMEQLHSISRAIFEEDKFFYDNRGVLMQSLEVTKYSCSDKRTSEVLQQIIEETTNRLNRLSQAESENEVNMFKMQGQIEQEKLNAELLQIQHEHTKSEADVAGDAEAQKVAAFMSGMEKTVPKLEDRISMWKNLRQIDTLAAVSEGNAKLYYTPKDVNLSVKVD